MLSDALRCPRMLLNENQYFGLFVAWRTVYSLKRPTQSHTFPIHCLSYCYLDLRSKMRHTWKMFAMASAFFLLFLSVAETSVSDGLETKRCFKPPAVTSMYSNTPPHPWVRGAESSCYSPRSVLNSPTQGTLSDHGWYFESEERSI